MISTRSAFFAHLKELAQEAQSSAKLAYALCETRFPLPAVVFRTALLLLTFLVLEKLYFGFSRLTVEGYSSSSLVLALAAALTAAIVAMPPPLPTGEPTRAPTARTEDGYYEIAWACTTTLKAGPLCSISPSTSKTKA